MKRVITNLLIIAAIACVFIITASMYLYGNSSGITERTRKTTQAGCGATTSCHAIAATTSLNVSINGPSTLLRGQTAAYNVTISGSGSGGGIDIAVSSGTLNPTVFFLRRDMSNGELTHTASQPLSAVYNFNYTTPDVAGAVTMYAVGKGVGFNTWNWAPNKTITINNPVGVEDRVTTEFRSQASLYQNTPNPFNPSTRIRYAIAKENMVTLTIYSTLGQSIRTLVNERQSPAHYEVIWDGRNDIGVQAPSGIYLYILQTESLRLARKLIMLK